MKYKNHKIFIKYVISLSLATYFIFSTNINSIKQSIQSIPLASYFLSIIIYFVALSLNALKWKRLFSGRSYIQLFKYVIMAQYYSMVLPGGVLAGEMVKAYRIGKGENDAEKIAASIIIDRITGFLGLIIVGYMGLIFSSIDISNEIIYIFSGTMFLLLAVLLSLKNRFLESMIMKALSKAQHYNKYMHKYIVIIKIIVLEWRLYLNRPVILIESIIIGISFQLTGVYMIYILALGSHIGISFFDLCWIYGIISIIIFIPISIAGLGLREGGFIALFAMISLSPESALALSLSVFSLQIIGGVVGAIIEIRDHKNVTSGLKRE